MGVYFFRTHFVALQGALKMLEALEESGWSDELLNKNGPRLQANVDKHCKFIVIITCYAESLGTRIAYHDSLYGYIFIRLSSVFINFQIEVAAVDIHNAKIQCKELFIEHVLTKMSQYTKFYYLSPWSIGVKYANQLMDTTSDPDYMQIICVDEQPEGYRAFTDHDYMQEVNPIDFDKCQTV